MKIKNIGKTISHLTLLAGAMFFSTAVNASCLTNRGAAVPQTLTVNMPQVTVQRDAPVGSVIATISSSAASGSAYESCDATDGKIFYEMSLFTTPTSIEHVYETNVPGVGISVEQSGVYFFEMPASYRTFNDINVVSSARTVRLIKTGPITAGVINSGVLTINYGDGDHITGLSLIIIGAAVTPVACSINTPNISVPLDDVSASEFTAVGNTPKSKPFDIGLSCDPGARINAKLTGIQNSDSSADGVLQLTGAGGDNVAKGVGIQILYNNAPMALNNNIVLKSADGGQETFPFTAQYFQTKNDVSAGSANATATLELTYQ